MPLPAAFIPRPNEEYLSVDWLEKLGKPDVASAIQELRKIISQFYVLNKNGKFAVLRNGEMAQTILQVVKRQISVTHEPLQNRVCHSGIRGYSSNDQLIAAMIVELLSEEDMYDAV